MVSKRRDWWNFRLLGSLVGEILGDESLSNI